MHNYISQEKTFENKNTISVYGTTKYSVIWEDICCRVLNDKRNNIIKNIVEELPNDNFKIDKIDDTLLELIEKPKWVYFDGSETETDRLKPDLITFDDDTFVILDAKYYDLTFEQDDLKGQPGLKAITKQFLYELAYKEFMSKDKAGFEKSKNAFLFPIYGSESELKPINKGYVDLKFLTDIPLEKIQVIMLPVSRMNKLYLKNKHMDISELKLDDFSFK